MAKNARETVSAAVAVLILSFGLSRAQAVELKIKAKPGEVIQYRMTADILVDTEFSGIPFPKIQIAFKNVQMKISADMYWIVDDVTEEGDIIGRLAFKNTEIVFGGLLPASSIFELMGMKSMNLPDMGFTITSQGKIGSMEMDMSQLPMPMSKPESSGDDEEEASDSSGGGMGGLGIDPTEMMAMVLPMMVEMMPPVLPAEPVEAGAKWGEIMDLGMGQMPMLPKINFDFTLKELGKDGVAVIAVDRVGKYDGAALKSFLSMFPSFTLGDTELTLKNLDIKANWDERGAFKLDIENGRPLNMVDDQKVHVDFAFAIRPLKPDPEKNWDMNGAIDMRTKPVIDFVKLMTLKEFQEAFPAPPEEPAPESEESDESM